MDLSQSLAYRAASGRPTKEFLLADFDPFMGHPGFLPLETQQRVDVYRKTASLFNPTTLDAKKLAEMLPMSEKQMESCIGEIHVYDAQSPPFTRGQYERLDENKECDKKFDASGANVAFSLKGENLNDVNLIYYNKAGSIEAIYHWSPICAVPR